MQEKKSQVATEFILILSILLIVFLSFMVFHERRETEFLGKQDELAAKITAEKVAISINAAYLLGDGAIHKIIIPDKQKIDSISISPQSREVITSYKGRHYSYPLLTSNISEQILVNRTYTIYNRQGEIIIVS